MSRRILSLAGMLLLASAAGAVLSPTAHAQAASVPIEENATDDAYAVILERAGKLREADRLVDAAHVRKLLVTPTPAPIKLLAPATKTLSRQELARRSRAALVRVGWLYRDADDEDWQLDLAGGYAIAEGGIVATCRHVVDPDYPSPITDGYLIAACADGSVVPVTAILAVDEEMDAAIVRLDLDAAKHAGVESAATCLPLALNDQSMPGDAAYVFSDPMGVPGYFSEGMINRFYWFDPAEGKDATELDGARNLRIHVSADWAPGSSGAAVLDERGNVLGHVSEIESLLDDPSLDLEEPGDMPSTVELSGSDGKKKPAERDGRDGSATSDDYLDQEDEQEESAEKDPLADDSATMMVLHSAVSARGVRLLAESCDAAAR